MIMLKKVPTPRALPYRIAVNSKGVPFFCEFGTNRLARIDPQAMDITEYVQLGARPRRLAFTPNDMVYYSDNARGYVETGLTPNRLIGFNPTTQTFSTPTPISSGGSVVRNMVATPDGKLYLACSGVNKIGIAEILHQSGLSHY
jgi:virginiamycin B lyase